MRARIGVAGALAGLMVLTGLTPVAASDGVTGIAGQVLREDGSPVPGATVTATPESKGTAESTTTTTDGSGRYTLDTEPGGHALLVSPDRSTSDLAARQVLVAIESRHRTTRDVVLRSANLTGLVRGADGAPVAGARVTVWQHSYSTREMHAQAAADGTFAMTVGSGELSIWANPPPTLAPHTHAGSTKLVKTVPVGGVLDGLVLDLRQVALTGRVLGPDGTTPVVGARLEVQSPDQPNGSFSRDTPQTGADGTFAAALSTTGTVSILARPPLSNPEGWGQVKLTVEHPGPGRTDAGDILLDGDRNVSGRVVTPTGEGVAGAEVKTVGRDVDSELVHVTTVADASGNYRLAMPPSRQRNSWDYGYSIIASGPGDTNELLEVWGPTFHVSNEPVELPDIALRVPNLRGYARAPLIGDPLRGITVRAFDASGDEKGSSTTDSTGLFGMVVPAGEYELVAEPTRERDDNWIRKTVRATVQDGTVTTVDVGFRVPPAAPYTLDSQGLPLPPLDGLKAVGHGELAPSLSPNGRYAVYTGRYQDADAPPSDCSSGEWCPPEPATTPLFRVDLTTGETVRADLGAAGAVADDVRAAAVSDSGDVVFVSATDGLAEGDADRSADVFLRRPEQATTVLLSDERVRSRSWGDVDADVASAVSVSSDGTRVAWVEPRYTTGGEGYEIEAAQVVVFDVSTAARRVFPEALAASPFLSADGSTLAYTSHMGGWEWDPAPGHVDDNDGNHRTQLEVVDLTAPDDESDAVFEVYDGTDSPWIDRFDELPDHSAPTLSDDGRVLAYSSYADPCDSCNQSGYGHAANVVEWRAPESARQFDPFAGAYSSRRGPERTALSGDGRQLAVLGSVTDYDEAAEASPTLWRHDLVGGATELVAQRNGRTLGGGGTWTSATYMSQRPFGPDGGLVAFAVGGAGNDGRSATAYLGRLPETDPPTWDAAAALTASDIGTASLRLTWTAATDEVGLAGYRVYRDGNRIADVPASQLSTVVSGLRPATTYQFTVEAYDYAGNVSTNGPSTRATTLDADTTELLPLSARTSGSDVLLGWDPAPATADGLLVRRAVNGGPQTDLATLARDAVSFRDPGAPASTEVSYQVWTTDTSGAATPFTTVATVTTPDLVLSSVDWSAPTATGGALRLHEDLTLTVRGSPGRSATALVSYTSWYDNGQELTAPAQAEAVVGLSEVSGSPGVYRGVFPLAEGVASVTGVTGRLSDGGDKEVARAAGRLPVAVSGAVRAVIAAGQPLDGTVLTVVSAATGFGAQHALSKAGPLDIGAVPAGEDYVADVRADGTWSGARSEGIVVQPGRTAEVTLDVVLPARVLVTVTTPEGASSSGWPVQLVDVESGSVLASAQISRGPVALGPVIAGRGVRIEVAPPGGTDYLPVSRELVLPRGDSAVSLEVSKPVRGTVRGVVQASGRGLHYARVTVVHNVNGASRTSHAMTDAEGRYSLDVYEGPATLSAYHKGIDVGPRELTVRPAEVVVHDVDVPQPTPQGVLMELRTRRSSASEWSRAVVDWRTAVHYGGMQPTVNGHSRPHSWRFDDSTGQNILVVDAIQGETVRVCANAREAGLGSGCGEAVFTPDLGSTLRIDIGPAPVVKGRLANEAGTSVNGSFTLSRITADGASAVRSGSTSNGQLQVETPGEPGSYSLLVSSAAGRASRTFTVAEDPLDLGTIVLRTPTTFTSDANTLRSLEPVARPGQLLALEATLRNDSSRTADPVTARVELPAGVELDPRGSLVDGKPASSPGAGQVTIGSMPPGEQRTLRLSARVPDGYAAHTLPIELVLMPDGAPEDHLPALSVPVELFSINQIPVLGSRTFPVGGSAPPGTQVSVRDGSTVLGTATAGTGGRWRARVTLPGGEEPSKHELTATIEHRGDVLTALQSVFIDPERPTPSSVTLAQGGDGDRRSHSFDPRDGTAGFTFVWAPGQPVELKAGFENADRLASATFYVGDQKIPSTRRDDGSFTARPMINKPGDVYVETELGAPPSANDAPRGSWTGMTAGSASAGASARLPDGFRGYGMEVERETETEMDLAFTLPAIDAGATGSGRITTRRVPGYYTTADDQISSMRTGYDVHGLSVTNSGSSISLRFVLPKSEVERFGGSMENSSMSGSGGAARTTGSGSFSSYGSSASAIKWVPEGVEFAIAVSTGGWDVFSTIGAGGKYGELNKLLNMMDAMNCSPEFNAKWLAEIEALANWMIAADAATAVLTVAGAVAGTFTAGVGAIAVWGVGLVAGLIIDDMLSEKAEDLERRMAQDSDCFRPKKKKVASPTWIIDPSGYTYEGLRERRIPGVTTTLLSAPTADGPWSVAQMEQYAQDNPLSTDGEGRYAWNVPEGWWKVQYVKDGYESSFSRPLQVLPPHLDVDEPMVPLQLPEALSAETTGERAFRVGFSQLMRVISVSRALVLWDAEGQAVPATVTAVDGRADDAGVELAESFLVVPEQAQPDGRYVLEVPAAVQNHAGRLTAAAAQLPVTLSSASSASPAPTPTDGPDAAPSSPTPAPPTPAASASSSPASGGTGAWSPPASPPSGAPTSPSATPARTPTASPASSPSGTPSRPADSPAPAEPTCRTLPRVELELSTITATGSSRLTVHGEPGADIDLLAYTRPSTTYRVVRTGTLDQTGRIEFRVVPPANTRLYAQQRGCGAGPSVVLNVRTALTITAVRNGKLAYRFAGDSLPARKGGLIVSLYRVTSDGRQVLTAQVRAGSSDGEWSLNRRFLGSGRFGFVARTGQDLQNAPGSSSVRPTVLH